MPDDTARFESMKRTQEAAARQRDDRVRDDRIKRLERRVTDLEAALKKRKEPTRKTAGTGATKS